MYYASTLLRSKTATTRYRSLLVALGLGLTAASGAAAQAAPDSLGGLTRVFRRYQRTAIPEKLFLHLDRPFYTAGETMWFKVYAVDGTSGRPLPMSKVANVEVLNHENKPVLQARVELRQATGQGSFTLPASLASGTYTVRAYTNWMQNFGPEYYFHSSVTVVNTFAASGTAAQDSIKPYTVQFFPEGGNLVQGLPGKVGFQATSSSGKGVSVEGKVLTQTGAVVATFKTLRFGLGSFSFTPEAGNTYTAVVTQGKGKPGRYQLPPVYAQGYAMRLERPVNAPLTITVRATTTQPETVYLLGHAGQTVAVAAQATLRNGGATFTVEPGQLPDGISHFTLFNADRKPLCERLYFQPPRNKLTVTAQTDKNHYALRDQVALSLATAARAGQALAANLSVAVYRLDSLSSPRPADINSYLWLSADLKGEVESPEYYFTATGPEAAEATDNLMLTQGWSRFRWEQVLASAPAPLPYLPELRGPLVQARLTQPGTDIPRPGVTAYLASPSRLTRLTNAVSNADGLVQFEADAARGTRELIIQTDPRQDSTAQIKLLSPFSGRYAPALAPAFRALPSLEAAYTKRHFQTQVQTIFAPKEALRPTPAPPDSLAFYGKPSETYFLDKYTRFKVLEEVMREYVPGVMVRIRKDGFHFMVLDKVNNAFLTENPMVLLDGVPVFSVNKMMAMDPLKIQKLEVIDSRYFHGSTVYNGIVSYTTYKGDLEGFELDPRALIQQYEVLQAQREFYSPRYDTPQQKQSRLPDMRNLLYWNPSVTTTAAGPRKLEFYTGDQAGRYLVVVQGLAPNGQAGSSRTVLEVKPAL
ncbi:MG2 domain-containing protein [Hymenobacter sp. UYP22]|uniref:MG2 domain-containing protein n=1 Tax=Hymenobacter sp. UYP22 TaxID=3156348 RepID=UPI003393255D